MIHKRRTTCRLCSSPDVENVFSLEPSPLAEAYLPSERAHEADARYPVDVFLCRACGGVQLLDVIDAGHLFRDYGYTSSMSPDLADHFDRYAASVCERFKPEPGSLVIDVGSNDGTLLRQFQKRGLAVQGVEPAKAIAVRATKEGIPTYWSFMDAAAAKELTRFGKHAAIVTANNVLAHAEEPGTILDGVRECLADDGVFVFEVAYLPDQLLNMMAENFYHEHGVFYTVRSVRELLWRHGLSLVEVEKVPTKGGSIRGFARKGQHAVVAGDDTPHQATFLGFMRRVSAVRDETQRCLREYQSRNLRVAGYGANSTTTLLLHHFKIGGFLDYLVDDNQARWDTVSPGYHLSVCSPEAIYGGGAPDAIFVCAWRFAEQIMARHPGYKGAWIVPLPTFREVVR